MFEVHCWKAFQRLKAWKRCVILQFKKESVHHSEKTVKQKSNHESPHLPRNERKNSTCNASPNQMQMCKSAGEKLTLFRSASNKWITRITQRTTTDRIVIDSMTASLITTRTRSTCIDALMIYTRSIGQTIRIDCTFWAASWWTANVIFKTRTNCMIVYLFTLTVRSTRWWMTQLNLWLFGYWIFKTTNNISQVWTRWPTTINLKTKTKTKNAHLGIS